MVWCGEMHPSIWEVEVGGSGVQTQLHNKVEVSQG